jgi:L-amino acid N-acyltransferase YncA
MGELLLQHLIGVADDAGVWMIQTGIFPENAASLALHRACGFAWSGGGSGSGACKASGGTAAAGTTPR